MKHFGIYFTLMALFLVSVLNAESLENGEKESLESLAKDLAVIKASLAETKLALETTKQEANWVWTCIAAFLVFLCKLGLRMSKQDLREPKMQ